MKSSGESGPRSGCGQRTSASTAASRPPSSSTWGWKPDFISTSPRVSALTKGMHS